MVVPSFEVMVLMRVLLYFIFDPSPGRIIRMIVRANFQTIELVLQFFQNFVEALVTVDDAVFHTVLDHAIAVCHRLKDGLGRDFGSATR
jgi:hypothetical protein